MSDLGFLFAGFAAAWAVAFAYLWSLAKRTQALQQQLSRIEERIDRDG